MNLLMLAVHQSLGEAAQIVAEAVLLWDVVVIIEAMLSPEISII